MALEAQAEVRYSWSILMVLRKSRTDAMAHLAWVTTSTRWCDLMKAEAHLMEHRVFPAEIMPDFPNYRINARKCSLGTACNLAGFPCKWAYKEQSDDPYEPTV